MDIDVTHDTWSINDVTSVYTHLSTRGYQYGPSFRNMQSLRGTTSTSCSCKFVPILVAINDLSCYHLLHPTLMDAFLHPLLAMLPGVDTTFIPVSIQKFVITNK